MPYIEQQYRQQIDEQIDALATAINVVYHAERIKAQENGKAKFQTRDGLLNYAITRILNQVFPEPNYHEYNEAIGMLECCKNEYYRVYVAPYEELKSATNDPVPVYTQEEIQQIIAVALAERLSKKPVE